MGPLGWDWQSPTHPRAGQPSLSSLVLRLVLLNAARRDLLTQLLVRPNFVAATRGPATLDESFSVDPLILARGKALPLL